MRALALLLALPAASFAAQPDFYSNASLAFGSDGSLLSTGNPLQRVLTLPSNTKTIFDYGVGSQTSSAAPATNTIYYSMIYVPKPVTPATYFYRCGASCSGNINMGVYANTALNRPGSVIVSGTDAIGSGEQAITPTTPVSLGPGYYWVGVQLDNTASPTFNGIPVSAVGYTTMSGFGSGMTAGAPFFSGGSIIELHETTPFSAGLPAVASSTLSTGNATIPMIGYVQP